MVFRIDIKEPTDHSLILGIVFPRLVLEELDATLTQGDRYLYTFIPENKVGEADGKNSTRGLSTATASAMGPLT